VSKFIHPITIKAAVEVASNLRPDDRREVEEGHGLDPMVELVKAAHEGSSVYFTVPNGKTAGMAGVNPEGVIWMLTTPAIEEYPHTFARESKRFVDARTEPLLWNIVDERNKVHLKLLKFLGFKFLRKILHGPHHLSFIEFSKINVRS
jgi:hypothetical protein